MLFTKKPLAILVAIVAVVHAAPVAVETRHDVDITAKSFDTATHNRAETNARGFHYPRKGGDVDNVHKRDILSRMEGLLPDPQETVWDVAASLNNELFPILVYGEEEPARRAEWVKAVIDMLAAAWPSKNVILFKRYMGFTIDSPNYAGDYQETSTTYVDERSGISTDFGLVSFTGQGTLRRNGADGGWQNWGYYGTYSTEDDGTRIEFY